MPQSPGEIAQLACVLEVLAPKAGNVHPRQGFADLSWTNFVISAAAIRPVLDEAPRLGVGRTVLRCIEATRQRVACNTNLGMVLLLAPLCAAHGGLRQGVRRVLDELTPRDARLVYQAIRLAQPGGMGKAPRGDVAAAPPRRMSLRDLMALAAHRDAIARQYVTGFANILDHIAVDLLELVDHGATVDEAIVTAHLRQMAREPDSLILRKCGPRIAGESQRRAVAVLAGNQSFATFDRWLRADANRRNPGTSADLIAAGLYVALRGIRHHGKRRKVRQPVTWTANLIAS